MTTLCRPHDWAPPAPTDRQFTCRRRTCGRVLDFHTELDARTRADILNSLRGRRSPAEVAVFLRCLATYSHAMSAILDPVAAESIADIQAEAVRLANEDHLKQEAKREAMQQREARRRRLHGETPRQRMAREQGGAA